MKFSISVIVNAVVATVMSSVSLNNRERVEGATLRGEKNVFE
jgi:hypothetical protein